MRFVKPLLHGAVPKEADGTQLGSLTLPAASLNRGMPVEVMTDFDTVLLFGRLTEASPAHLKIERMLDDVCFPVLNEGRTVLVRGYDERMAPFILRAVVAGSSGFGCTLEYLERIDYKTERKLVRYPLCPPGAVHVLDDSLPERSRLCQLLNISVGGACVVSEQPYVSGQSLRIRIGPAEDSAAYPCQIVRVTPRRGGFFEYGLWFVHLDRELRRNLTRDIQAIQEETGKRLLPRTVTAMAGLTRAGCSL